ncbi:MAG TPA: efflux RND transporter permease subunit [Candidatus Acidoferrales bacterium]|nr:efflux RND transporter permease subunit [Candidatus Acidoferrales bacterium]
MWIVRLALSRPYTFVVASMLIIILSVVAIQQTPVDIFPNINIPVVSVIWNYSGLAPQDMADRLTGNSERIATTTVNDIQHIESTTLNGIAIVKLFFQPNTKIEAAVAQVTSAAQVILRQAPPGTTPPLVIAYSASSVPILQLGLGSATLSEQQLFDIGVNFLRTQLITVPGAAVPWPYGGKQRQVDVDLDPQALFEKGISGADVVNAISVQNIVLPQGTSKIGDREYDVELNSSPKKISELNDLPIRVVNGATIYVHDVAFVHDGNSFQTNIVRQDGKRGVLITVLKSGNASTLAVVNGITQKLPGLEAQLPPELTLKKTIDQSLFVRAAVNGVLKEAVIAACLTALMILLFLGSWRSTIVVAVSIPLSILTSLLVLSALGETINIMTLGGLALAVGILVDDATVEIENINRLLPMGKPLHDTILLGAQQIAVPAFVATLSICVVFVPIFFLRGIAGYLFRPLAEAVVFAMLASYLLSRTIVPTLVLFFFRAERRKQREHPEGDPHPGVFRRLHLGFEGGFEKLRDRYVGWLEWCLHNRLAFSALFLAFCAASMLLIPFLGSDLFPTVDSGQIRLHVRAPVGLRVEETAALADRIEESIRKQIPAQEMEGILDNIGLPYSGINLSYSTAGTIGTSDAEILISLKEDHHPTANYIRELRKTLPGEFPGSAFYFQPADIVSQILNFGLPSPIDVQLVGPNFADNFEVARKMLPRIQEVGGAVDVHIQQALDLPKLHVEVDRTRAESIGFTQQDVANNALVALTTSFQTAPNFWISPQGVPYVVATLTPQYRVDTMRSVQGIPVIGRNGQPQILDNVASITREAGPAVVNHYDIMPVIDIYASAQDRDLGGVAAGVSKVIDDFKSQLPRGTTIVMRGQVATMRTSFAGLAIGLLFSIVLVYLLMVVNFQSWADPFIIITALTGTFAGIVWMLFVTRTTMNVPSLMGAIMSIGVATSNSILLVTFAGAQMRDEGKDSLEAAKNAGHVRLRPIIMTALAMIIGMLPMSLGFGEGGEQNAPLGRAVIGGLMFATIGTLFFVPVVYSFIRKKGYKAALAED